MKSRLILLTIGLILCVGSLPPMFNIIREIVVNTYIDMRYEVQHAYQEADGYYNIVDTDDLHIEDHHIEIVEENTGEKAPLTLWDQDENVPPGDIIDIYFILNGEQISEPSPIWLSNRDRGSRYFSWIDILTVDDRLKNESMIKIIQRLTDGNTLDEKRMWRILTIPDKGSVQTEEIVYTTRSDDVLNVKLIRFSGTSLISLGIYSDIMMGYPNIIFPLLYPFLTSLIGIILLFIYFLKRKRQQNYHRNDPNV